jgi:acetolactate synthase-1/3 small subunit
VDSIAAGPTENREITRITLVVTGDEKVLDQVVKQFRKLIDVIKVEAIPHEFALTGELALITVEFSPEKQTEITQLIGLLGFKVKNIGRDSVTVMISGSAQTIDTAINGLSPYTIKAMARTGLVALPLDREE